MPLIRVRPDVADALAAGRPVVALESTIISHGLPRPDNLRVAREVEAVVREAGAVPATIGVVGGEVVIGLDDDELVAIATRDGVLKASVRDLALVVATHAWAATTVAATSHLAAREGIGVFATGGLGGVHREARESWDESADLSTLATTPITVVSAGVKSILDVPATLERLESLSIAVVGYRTHRFPGFYLTDSGHPLEWRLETPEEIAAVIAAREQLGTDRHALLVANPLPADVQVDPGLHARVLQEALDAVLESDVRGKAVTPFLLERFHAGTGGASLAANTEIIRRNAQLAAQIAVARAALAVRA